MKKKLWCVLCIMICMMMIAACGQKKNPEKKKSEKAEQEETEFKDRESLKLSLFTVYYPKAWNYDKENMKKDEEYSYVRFFDGDTADGSENVISIEATKEDSYTYRKNTACPLWPQRRPDGQTEKGFLKTGTAKALLPTTSVSLKTSVLKHAPKICM